MTLTVTPNYFREPERAIGRRKSVAIVQSNYIPWRGYFDLINLVDEFILLDDAQYTRRDWRNRNILKSCSGPIWLTIPVKVKGRYLQPIKDTIISDPAWNRRHWKTIVSCYSNARYFALYKPLFEELYLNSDERYLSKINYQFLTVICNLLEIRTRLTWSMDYRLSGRQTERIVDLCKQAGANYYLTGPKAKYYLNEKLFHQAGISVTFMDYEGYPEYKQLCPPFEPKVSIIDLIFNEGRDAPKYLKSFSG